jgi:multidrug efflux pump subunit AcrA (membrane-fusion protein)
MKEKSTKKEWIKTFAIIFLAVLLVLTFFSNTIQNYSLPEVAAQYTSSGSITNKVRGQGTVETADPYSVVYKQARKIESVSVKVGDTVEKGDTLYVLEAGKSDELTEAENTLETLESAYRKSIISGSVTSSVTNAAENGNATDVATIQAKIDTLQKKIDAYKAEQETLNNQINLWTYGTASDLTEIKNLEDAKDTLSAWKTQDAINNVELTSAQSTYTSAQSAYDSAKDAYDEYLTAVKNNTISSNDETDSKLKKAYESAESALSTAKSNVDSKQNAVNNSDAQVTYYTELVSTRQQVIDDKLTELNNKLKVSESNLTKVQTELTDYVTSATTALDLSDQLEAIEKQKEKVNELTASEGGTEITAPVSGTVLTMAYVSGETTVSGENVATIQVAGKGFTLSMNVTNEQAALLTVGDEAEVTNSWWYTDVHARIQSIRPNPSAPSSGKVVTFEIEGDVTNGQSLSLTVGKRTSNYDNIVPTSAIREDNNGKFVYKVVSKSTPLGNRYTVERVDVTVLAEDDTQSAISGALEGYEYIVTTSSKPLTDGQQIRLKD